MIDSIRLGRNFGVTALSQLLSQVLTFLVSVALARSLGVEQYGIFAFGFAFPTLFLLIASLGLDSVFTIDVAADRSKASAYLTAIVVLRLPLVAGAIGALWISVNLLLVDPFARTITMLLGVASVMGTYATTFSSVFRAYERLEFGALVTIVERSLTSALVLFLLLFGFGLFEISLVFVLGSAITLVLTMSLVRAKFTWLERRADRATSVAILRKTLPFALSAVVSTLLVSTGPILLTILQDATATGQFNAGFALVLALLVPLSIFHIVFLPTMSRIYRETPERLSIVLRKTQKLFFLLGLPAALGAWFYADEIMTLIYGGAFAESARSFEVLVFIVAVSTADLGVGAALAAANRQPLALLAGAIASAIFVGLCLVLIPSSGHVGAAYALLVAHIVGAILGLAMVHRLVARIAPWEVLARPVIAGMTMILALFFLPDLPLGLGVLAGGFLYFLVLSVIRGITREDLDLLRDALRGALFR